jgi:bacterioferritin-associated ferredoxin
LTIILIEGHTGAALRPSPPVYVCVCYGITDRQIRETAQAGCRSVSELTMRTGAGANCGSCLEVAAQVLDEVHASRVVPLPLPILSHAA